MNCVPNQFDHLRQTRSADRCVRETEARTHLPERDAAAGAQDHAPPTTSADGGCRRLRCEIAHLQLLWTVNAPELAITAILQLLIDDLELLLVDDRGVLAREAFLDLPAAYHYAFELRHRLLAKGWTEGPALEQALALAAMVA